MSKDLIFKLLLAFIPKLTVACSFVSLDTSGGGLPALAMPYLSCISPFPRSLPFELAPNNPV